MPEGRSRDLPKQLRAQKKNVNGFLGFWDFCCLHLLTMGHCCPLRRLHPLAEIWTRRSVELENTKCYVLHCITIYKYIYMLIAIPTSRLQSYKVCSGFSLPSSLQDRLQRDSLELQDLYLKCLRHAVESPEVGTTWSKMKVGQLSCTVCEVEERRFKCDCKSLCHSLIKAKVPGMSVLLSNIIKPDWNPWFLVYAAGFCFILSGTS